MKSPELLDRVRRLRPENGPGDFHPLQTDALLDRILLTRPEQSSTKHSVRKIPIVLSACAAGGMGLAFAWSSGEATATIRVAKAADASAALGTGRATMRVNSTLNGAPNNGTVELAWESENESYVFDYPDSSGNFETRVLDGRVLQRLGNDPWKVVGDGTSQLSKSGGLAAAASRFDVLANDLTFEDLGKQGGLRHFRATGDLTSLDTSNGGFVFGTNGAPNAKTTALEVWVDEQGLIARVRTEFSGNPDGQLIEAEALTELRDLGKTIEVLDPLAATPANLSTK
jgi:hypothetical protein